MTETPDTGPAFTIRPVLPEDAEWVKETIAAFGGGEPIITPGGYHCPTRLSGFVAVAADGRRIGLLTYSLAGDACEIVTLEAMERFAGIGTALMEAAAGAARRAGCGRLWLVTSNDNLPALRFYQARGLRMVAVHRNAFDAVRREKPWLPETGLYGIPMRDLIELEMPMAAHPDAP